MSIEAGARAGMVAPDDVTYAYLDARPYAPKGADWDQALERWRALPSDQEAHFDQEAHLDAGEITPMVTWGTSPAAAAPITGVVRIPPPPRPAIAKPWSRRSPIWGSHQAARFVRLPSIGSSSAPARIAGSRICGRRPRSRTAGAPWFPRWWSRALAWSRLRPKPRASTLSSGARVSSGASRVAQCASA